MASSDNSAQTPFEQRLEELERVLEPLTRALQQYAIPGNWAAQRVGCCGTDIVTQGFVLLDLHAETVEVLEGHARRATQEFLASQPLFERLRDGGTPTAQELASANVVLARQHAEFEACLSGPARGRNGSVERLFTAYKAMLYFVRSFQDALAAGVRLLEGTHPGAYTSMEDALNKPSKDLQELLVQNPRYESSFRAMRKARNRVKEGISFSVVGPENDPGITFQNATYDEQGTHITANVGQAFRLSDLARDLDITTAFCRSLIDRLNR